MKDKDPIKNMRFYCKDDPTTAIRIRKDQVWLAGGCGSHLSFSPRPASLNCVVVLVPGVQTPPRDLFRAADQGVLQEEGRRQPGSSQKEVRAVVHESRLLKAAGQIRRRSWRSAQFTSRHFVSTMYLIFLHLCLSPLLQFIKLNPAVSLSALRAPSCGRPV